MTSRDFDFGHQPVLFSQTLDCLAVDVAGNYLDCTVGGGGHAAGILSRLSAAGHFYGLDKDPDALAAATARLLQLASPATWELIHSDFASLDQICQTHQIGPLQGILADLGVSSWQLDQAERGFTYQQDGPLDMRMNQTAGPTAADLVNTLDETELVRILRDYGEERYAARISRAIVQRRQVQPFTTTADLAAVVKAAMPGQGRQEPQHPARRTFQAIRIAVNQELAALEKLLAAALGLLAPGGRLCIITFHSLEDRLVKEAFRRWENPCTCPREFPVCICGRTPQGEVLTRRPIVADPAEIAANPRARSAKLRCFCKH